MISQVFNIDCMVSMKATPDKFYDLAVVDPEYGIGFSDYERGGQGIKTKERHTKNGKKQWDANPPSPAYFAELFRVSKNQIIWGGNYFGLPATQCFIFWYKKNPVPNFADGEYAWTSFKKPAVCFDYRYYGGISGKTSAPVKIHPTQKPVELYDFIYDTFLPAGGGGIRYSLRQRKQPHSRAQAWQHKLYRLRDRCRLLRGTGEAFQIVYQSTSNAVLA